MDPKRIKNKSDFKPKTDTRPTIVDPRAGSPGTLSGRPPKFAPDRTQKTKDEETKGIDEGEENKNEQKSQERSGTPGAQGPANSTRLFPNTSTQPPVF